MSVRIISKAFKLVSLQSNNYLKNATARTWLCGCKQEKYSSTIPSYFTKTVTTDPETGEPKKKKAAIIPKITLLSGDTIMVTTVEEAQKLSKRRDLKLVKIVDLDTKTHRPVYKLMTGADYHAEELKQREQRKKEKQNSFLKGEKVVILNANIFEHDLQVQAKKIGKWLGKMHEVRIVINGASGHPEKAEQIYNFLETTLKDEARFLQKRLKGTDMKFQILPPKKLKSDNTNSSDSGNSL